MIQIIDKSQCCGCTACESACVHKALKMTPDPLGFLYPVVDSTKCNNCGLCESICQFHDNYNRYDNYDKPIVYSLRLKEEKQLMRSQSGGAFFAIARIFIREGGVVYGAAFGGHWRVSHQAVANSLDIEKLRMTKYVQSDLRGVFAKVKEDLNNNQHVLFSGTACQVAGLKSYLPISIQKNLLCIDIICHGVPSPQIWSDYIDYLERKYHSAIVKACFRDKRFGWHGARETFLFANGKEVDRCSSNYLYFSGLTLRDSCAHCKFTNTERVGDITIGDHWGLPKNDPYEKDAKGLSLVLVNSDKGKEWLEKIIEFITIREISLESCLQPQLQYPTKFHPKRDKFIADYKKHGFLYVARCYGDLGWKYKFETMINSFIKHIRKLYENSVTNYLA